MNDSMWLNDEQQQTWRAFVAMMGEFNAYVDRDLQATAGMPHTYYLILAMLSEAPDRTLRMSELAEKISSSASRLSHAVRKLEAKGWVRRSKSECDGRGYDAVLLDEGYRVLDEVAPHHVATVKRTVFDRLNAEQVGMLHEICNEIREGISQDKILRHGDAPGGSRLT